MQEAAAGITGSSVGRGGAGLPRSYRALLLCFGHWHCTVSGSPRHRAARDKVILCSSKSSWPGNLSLLRSKECTSALSDAIRTTYLTVQLFFPSFRGLRETIGRSKHESHVLECRL